MCCDGRRDRCPRLLVIPNCEYSIFSGTTIVEVPPLSRRALGGSQQCLQSSIPAPDHSSNLAEGCANARPKSIFISPPLKIKDREQPDKHLIFFFNLPHYGCFSRIGYFLQATRTKMRRKRSACRIECPPAWARDLFRISGVVRVLAPNNDVAVVKNFRHLELRHSVQY